MKNLIKLQEDAVAAILSAKPYATPRQYGFLNRKAMVIAGIHRKYIKGMNTLEIPADQHRVLWKDVLDVATLEDNAE